MVIDICLPGYHEASDFRLDEETRSVSSYSRRSVALQCARMSALAEAPGGGCLFSQAFTCLL